jgi:hypothetical protein
MNKPEDKKWAPITYASYYPDLREIAMEHGYALAIHGSMTRDFDLIAVAWTEEATEPLELLKSICKYAGVDHGDMAPYTAVSEKPHGRIAYVIPASFSRNLYFDISIIPPKKIQGVS